ncbi:MAG: (5-formylfuran-3-yl)methyl phosphate synthase [Pirellulaceae bacterium]
MSTSVPLAPVLDPRKEQLASAEPRLLVSIRNADEARLARSVGVDWIDLKNPGGGSLGAADELTCVAVAKELAHFSNPVHSAGCVSSGSGGTARLAARYRAVFGATFFAAQSRLVRHA